MDWYSLDTSPNNAKYGFADFWTLPPEKRQGKEYAIEAMRQYAKDDAWLLKKRGIVLAGDFGVGKTCLLWATLRWLGWEDCATRSYTSFLLDARSHGWAQKINQAVSYRLFALEECWHDPRYGRVKNADCYPGIAILSERLSANKPTILVTSHETKDEFYSLWREELTQIIDEHCIWVQMDGTRLRHEGGPVGDPF